MIQQHLVIDAHPIESLSRDDRLFFPGQRTVPKWVALLSSSFNLPADLFAQSPCALLVFKKDKFTFAVTFAYAHVYLEDSRTKPTSV